MAGNGENMMLKATTTFIVLLSALLFTADASACKYNIRDVGFVDLGSDRYQLYGCAGGGASLELQERLSRIGQTAVADSNIHFELVTGQEPDQSPAGEILSGLRIDTFPAAVLNIAEREPLVVPLPTEHEQMAATFATFVSSPIRETFLKKLKDVYALVLLVHGTEERQNNLARDAAQSAVEKISQVMGMMPKASGKPPELVELPFAARSEEQVLLWSLGIDQKDPAPAAVIIYGRARMLAKVLHGEEITVETLNRFLSVIGLDCECGLDRRWMTGRRLPITWDPTTRQQVARSLDFDPESPMIKMEISRILMKGPPGSGQVNWTQHAGPGFGYQEIEISLEPQPQEKPVQEPASNQHIEISEPIPTPAPTVGPTPAPVETSESGSFSGLNILVLVAAAVIVLGIGMTIALRKRENR
jgi:hypothetical protein